MKQFIHFKHPLLGNTPLQFQNPITHVIANDLADVKNAIEQVESYAKLGYYAVGYMSYEAFGSFYPDFNLKREPNIPYVYFGIYENKEAAMIKELAHKNSLKFSPNTLRSKYNEAIKYIQNSIDKGIVEQVNYTI